MCKYWYCETEGIIKQHKFCPNKQQYNNAKFFNVLAIEKVANYIIRMG